MTYATKYNIGSNQSTRTEETEAVVSAVGRVRRLDAKTKGRKRSTERQKEVSTDYGTGNGILGCTFLPKIAQSIDIQDCREMEREFYTSLSQLSEQLTKGTLVELIGRVSARAWTGSDGESKAGLNFHTSQIKLHGGGKRAESLQAPTEAESTKLTASVAEDLPF